MSDAAISFILVLSILLIREAAHCNTIGLPSVLGRSSRYGFTRLCGHPDGTAYFAAPSRMKARDFADL